MVKLLREWLEALYYNILSLLAADGFFCPPFALTLHDIVVHVLHCIVVEQADDGASLHGLSVGNHHICVLLKMLVS